MTSALINLKNKLLKISDNVYHYEAPKDAVPPYIMWQEVGGAFAFGDGSPIESVKSVQINIFSDKEFDPLIDEVLKLLTQDDIAGNYPATVYDADLKLIRTIIECEVV